MQEDLKQLIKSGCFDRLEDASRRPTLIWQILNSRRASAIFSGAPLFGPRTIVPPELPPYDAAVLRTQELETLGLPVSHHPLTAWRDVIARSGAIPAAELSRWVGRHVTLAGWWVTGKPIRTGDGKPMEFVTFEDESALFDATLFPAVYERFCRKLARARPYLIKGRVEEEFGVATLNVFWLGFLDEGCAAGRIHPQRRQVL